MKTKSKETMPGNVAETDDRSRLRADEPGFTDQAFDARYRSGQARVADGGPGGHPAAAPRPSPSGAPAALRSRNSYMRARRLSASL